MACDFSSTLHLEHAKAVHNLVVSKSSQSATVSNDVAFGLTPGAYNLVVVFVVGDRDVAVNYVTNLAEKFFSLLDNLLGLYFLLFDLLVECLRLGLLSRDVSLLIRLLLGGDSLADVTLILAHLLE